MARRSSSKSNTETPLSYYKEPFHEKTFFHYLLFVLVIVTLIISSFSLYKTNKLAGAVVADTINVNDFLGKLTSHDEMKDYFGVTPLNILQVNQNNLANLQTQINGLDTSYIGDFIVQYSDNIVIYDFNNDQIKEILSLQQPPQQLPVDLFTKLNDHYELQGLENEQPVGGQLDEISLNTLKQQFPDVYGNAKVGDFLLRYQTKLIIYDYIQDRIVNSADLG